MSCCIFYLLGKVKTFLGLLSRKYQKPCVNRISINEDTKSIPINIRFQHIFIRKNFKMKILTPKAAKLYGFLCHKYCCGLSCLGFLIIG